MRGGPGVERACVTTASQQGVPRPVDPFRNMAAKLIGMRSVAGIAKHSRSALTRRRCMAICWAAWASAAWLFDVLAVTSWKVPACISNFGS